MATSCQYLFRTFIFDAAVGFCSEAVRICIDLIEEGLRIRNDFFVSVSNVERMLLDLFDSDSLCGIRMDHSHEEIDEIIGKIVLESRIWTVLSHEIPELNRITEEYAVTLELFEGQQARIDGEHGDGGSENISIVSSVRHLSVEFDDLVRRRAFSVVVQHLIRSGQFFAHTEITQNEIEV